MFRKMRYVKFVVLITSVVVINNLTLLFMLYSMMFFYLVYFIMLYTLSVSEWILCGLPLSNNDSVYHHGTYCVHTRVLSNHKESVSMLFII